MSKRAVILERSWVANGGGAVGIFHYAVKVGDDWYEIEPVGDKGQSQKNSINGYLDGKPRSDSERKERITGAWTVAGATYKTDTEIVAFNSDWIKKYPQYHGLNDNCQKYALALARFLVGGSFKMEIPLSSQNAWADGPGAHSVTTSDYKTNDSTTFEGEGYSYHQSRVSAGKAGAQWKIFGVEVEGPSAAYESSRSYSVYTQEYLDCCEEYPGGDPAYLGVEASLGRVEVQAGPVGARVEPNLNTGIGLAGGQLKAKVVGFGKGFGVHTPLGSIGFGRF